MVHKQLPATALKTDIFSPDDQTAAVMQRRGGVSGSTIRRADARWKLIYIYLFRFIYLSCQLFIFHGGTQEVGGGHWLTCGTPILLQASKKFSTFLRHLAMLSFGWRAAEQNNEQFISCRVTALEYEHTFSVSKFRALTTAGEGTWMLATDRGEMLLAKWQRTTPSIRAAPTSSGSNTFILDSMFCPQDNNDIS